MNFQFLSSLSKATGFLKRLARSVTFGFALIAGGCASLGDALTYEISPIKLQERINAKLPVEECRILVLCLQVSQATVVLKEGSDRLGLKLAVKTSFGPVSRSGFAVLSSTLRFASNTASLHADNISVDALNFEALPQSVADALKATLPKLLQNELKTQALYSLPADVLSDKMRKATIKDIRVSNGKLVVQFGFL